MQLPFRSDVDRLAGGQVTHQLEAQRRQRHRLRRHHVLGAVLGLFLAETDRTDAARVAERQDAVAGDHRHHRVGALGAPVHRGHGVEDVVRLRAQLALAALVQLVGEHVQQHFGIRGGVDMAQIGTVEVLGERLGIGQVAVMGQGQAVGRVDVERLRLRGAGAAGGGVTHVTDAHVADQAAHVAVAEYVPDHAVVLAQEQPVPVAGDDAGGVLSPVLKNRQSVINRLVDVGVADNANNAAHLRILELAKLSFR